MAIVLWSKSRRERAEKAVAVSFVEALVIGLVIAPTLVNVAWMFDPESVSG